MGTMDIYENFEEILDSIEEQIDGNGLNGQTTESILNKLLENYFNESVHDNYIVSTIRFLTSYGLQSNKNEYEPFLLGLDPNYINMKLYCNHNVECLGQDADEMQIRAICCG